MPHRLAGSRPHRASISFSPPNYARRFQKALAAAALAGWLVVGSPAVLAQTPSVDPRATVSATAQAYPGATSVLLLDDIRFDVLPDRTHIFDEHDAIRVLTPDGVLENASLDRILDSNESSIEVLVARTIKADGRVLDAPPAELQPLASKSQVYSSFQRFSVRFPEVEVGDVVEFRLRTTHKPKPGGHFWATTFVENPMPIVDSSFVVTIPKDVPFRVATPGLVGGKATEETVSIDGKDYKRMSWHESNKEAFVYSPLAPSALSLLGRIEVSSFKNWKEVADFVGARWKENSTISEGLALRVAGWTPNTADPVQRAKAVLRELSRNRKAASFLSEEPDFHKPSQVFPEEVVSMADSSLLASVALSSAGVANIPVASTGLSISALDDELPHPEKVERIVLQIPLPDGTSRWVDPEAPGFLLNEPPPGTSDAAAFSWDSRFATGSSGLRELTPVAAVANREELAVEGRLERSGRAELTLQFDRYGGSALNARQAARDIKDGARGVRERALDSFFSNAAGAYGERARLLSRFFESDPEVSDPFSLAFTVAVPGFGATEGDVLTVPLPRFLSANIRAAVLEKQRVVPLRFDQPYQQDVRIHLMFPEGSTVTGAPTRIERNTPEVDFVATGRAEGNEIWYVGRLTVKDPWVDPAHVQRALEVLTSAIESENTEIKVALPAEVQAGGEASEDDEG